MKANVFRKPKDTRGWVFAVVVCILILMTCWPVITLFEGTAIILGLGIGMFWSYVIIISVCATLLVYDALRRRNEVE